MKIVNVTSNEAYQLSPGTTLEAERPNPFLNEWGEQTLPIDLPDTDVNRKLTEYPDLTAMTKKPQKNIECLIQDEELSMPCRQAILSAKRKEKISTSFYMNEGAFFSQISGVSLKELFGDEIIPGISTVTEGINFCKSLINGNNPNFAIFPILIDDGSTHSDSTPALKQINRIGWLENGAFKENINPGNSLVFYNEQARTENVNGNEVHISPGFYISPFIKANYLLRRIFSHFGYILKDNFFTQTVPFKNMVFLNNCADTLVNGNIRLVDLLPDESCSTILNVFRKRFFCEFIPDEVNRTVEVVFFNESINHSPITDLSQCLTSHPEVSFPSEYRQLYMSSEDVFSDEGSIEAANSMEDLATKYPTVEYDRTTGTFIRSGVWYGGEIFGGINPIFGPEINYVIEKVSPSSLPYYEGGTLKKEEITIPGIEPEFRDFYAGYLSPFLSSSLPLLFVGEPTFYNSKIIPAGAISADESNQTISTTTDNAGVKPMLAFFYLVGGFPRGTVTNYRRAEFYLGELPSWIATDSSPIKMFDYSLCFNGPDGTFEKFYRKYDDLLRNSLHQVNVSLLLPDHYKNSLPAHLPIMIGNQKYIFNNLKYNIGGDKRESVESELLTTKLYTPVTSAKIFEVIIPAQKYKWVGKSKSESVTESQYNSSPYKDLSFDPIYPSIRPSAAIAASGNKYYERTTCVKVTALTGGYRYLLIHYWMECEVKIF